MSAPEGTVRLAEAASQCGASVDVLKQLIESGHLTEGVVRGASGHVYLREDAIPAWTDVVEVLENRLRSHIAKAEKSLARIREEMEAVEFDLREVSENPLEALGYDASNFSATATGRREKSFGAALMQLQFDLGDVGLFSDALTRAHRVP